MAAPIPQPLAAQARARPDHPALVGAEAQDTLTYRALCRCAARRAARLAAAGVTPQARVALVGPPDLTFVTYLHALGWLGAQAVPLPHRAPIEDLAARLDRAEVSHAVVCGNMGISEETPHAFVAACAARGIPCLNTGAPEPEPEQGYPETSWPWDGARLRLQTSGTSGTPTLVDLDVAQLVLQAFGSATRLGHHIDDVWLGVLPLHHVGGLMVLYRALLSGATVHLPGAFDAVATARTMASGAISLVSLVPTMLAQVLDAWPEGVLPPARLRAILLGGAPTPQSLLDRAYALGLPISVTWGMTEAGSQICTRWPGSAGPAACVGPPLPFAAVGLHDGGFLVTGPGMTQAYASQDWGNIDADGVVTVLGRRDRVLISGGENIAPEEVEAVLLSHPLIADAAVVGEPDPLWGERPVAHLVAVLTPVPEHELGAFCRARLASFKVPVRFAWHAALPRDGMGKMQRARLLARP